MAHTWDAITHKVLLTVGVLFIVIPVNAQELIIDRDTITIYSGLEKALGKGFVEEKTGIITLPSGRTITTAGEPTFRIVKVTNISGNNPFNQVQPVFNFGGVQVASVGDLVDCIQSGKCASKTKTPGGGGGGGGGGESEGCCSKSDAPLLPSPVNRVPASDFFYYNVMQIYTTGTRPDISLLKNCDWVVVGLNIGETSTVKNDPVGLFVTTDPLWTPYPGYAYVGTNEKYFDMIVPPTNGIPMTKNGLNVYRISWGGNRITIQDKKTKQKFRIPFAVIASYENKGGKDLLVWQTLSIDKVFCSP